jgi:hypothetical protein
MIADFGFLASSSALIGLMLRLCLRVAASAKQGAEPALSGAKCSGFGNPIQLFIFDLKLCVSFWKQKHTSIGACNIKSTMR